MKKLNILNDDLDWLIRFLSIYNISKSKAYSLIEKISEQFKTSVKIELSETERMQFLLGQMRLEVQKIKKAHSKKRLLGMVNIYDN